MTEAQSYIIDIIKIIPNEATCFIQAPNLDDPEILALMQSTDFEYYKQIKLTEQNKKSN